MSHSGKGKEPDVKFSVACPQCRQRLGVDSKLSGQTIGCPKCRSRFTCPSAPARDTQVASAASPPGASSPVKRQHWYVRVAGQHAGPMTLDELRNMVARGAITPFDHVRSAEQSEWQEASSLQIFEKTASSSQQPPLQHSVSGSDSRNHKKAVDGFLESLKSIPALAWGGAAVGAALLAICVVVVSTRGKDDSGGHRTEKDLKQLTNGMLVGRARDMNVYDVAFPGDMMPDPTVMAESEQFAFLVFAIRIAEGHPIMVIKLVHFRRDGPLGVIQLTATAGTKKRVVHRFQRTAVTRQSVPGGVLEFATLMPFVDESATDVLSIITEQPVCNIEVKGSGGYTTFSPGIISKRHAIRMQELFYVLEDNPGLVSRLLISTV